MSDAGSTNVHSSRFVMGVSGKRLHLQCFCADVCCFFAPTVFNTFGWMWLMLKIWIFYYHSQYFIVLAFSPTLTSSHSPCKVLEYRLDRSQHWRKCPPPEWFSSKSEFQTHHWIKSLALIFETFSSVWGLWPGGAYIFTSRGIWRVACVMDHVQDWL